MLLPFFSIKERDNNDISLEEASHLCSFVVDVYVDSLQTSFDDIETSFVKDENEVHGKVKIERILKQSGQIEGKHCLVVTSCPEIIQEAVDNECTTVYLKKSSADWRGGKNARKVVSKAQEIEALIEDYIGVSFRI